MARTFRALGFEASEDVTIQGVRGQHDIDVLVSITVAGLKQLWVIECKAWKRRVRKEQVLTLSALIDDIGANAGFILSQSGYQSGAYTQAKLSRIELITLSDLRRVASPVLERDAYVVPYVEPTEHRRGNRGGRPTVDLLVNGNIRIVGQIDTGWPVTLIPWSLVELAGVESRVPGLMNINVFGKSMSVYGHPSCELTLPLATRQGTADAPLSWKADVFVSRDVHGVILGDQGFLEHFDITIRPRLRLVELERT